MPRLVLQLLALAALAPVTFLPNASTAATTGPTFVSYLAPDGEADSAAEPTLGVNLETGAVMYIAGLQTYHVGEWDKDGPGTSTWTDVSYPLTSVYTADPILETDTDTGRTFVNQLMYSNPGSVMAYTDDDGATWTPVPYGSGAGLNIDHQTVGFGKLPGPTGTLTSPNGYPNAIYYCTNDVVGSNCAVSVDGGNTFSPAHPAYSAQDCAPIHGHLKSAPDGTIYLPPDGCEPEDSDATPAGVAVSEDNSLTWSVRTVPGSNAGDAGHPSLGVATDGTLYLAYGAKGEDGEPYGRTQVARSTDKGVTWTTPVTLGAELGVKSSSFPIAVAGDGDRAAVGFLGTTDDGNPRATEEFQGRWDLYISVTYDGGKTWTTQNVTPDSPVQVGSICTGGLSCGGDRNLLDFNDMVIDEKGRVLVALADGCPRASCTPADRFEHGLIVRQSSGKGLLAEFDGGNTVTTPPTAAPSPSPSASPTRVANPSPPPNHPATGIPAVVPVLAVTAAGTAALAIRRRRRAA